MKNPALNSELYAIAREALQQGRTFTLVNEYGERKEFAPGTSAYTLGTLKSNICIAHDLGETLTIEFSKEDNTMNTTFNYDGYTYTRKDNGYCFESIIGEKNGEPIVFSTIRISKAKFEEAQREFEAVKAIEEAQESADTEAAKEFDQWAAEADAEYQTRKDLQEAKDEANYEAETSKPKKTRKPRRSKDIAYEGHGVTLTAKQVDFLRHLPDTCFWENGLDSGIWTDVLADEIGGQFKDKPMTTGAMLSTICEKGLGERVKDRINNRKATAFYLTELGKAVAAELGVH